MILLTSIETGMLAHIDEHDITYVDTIKEKWHSFSRVYLKNAKENHDFYLDVKEDENEIKHRIKYETLDLGCEARQYM